MKYFVANWKAHKTLTEAQTWLETFQELLTQNEHVRSNLSSNSIAIIICPPAPFIISLKQKLLNLPNYSLGSQDISSFPSGSYTGEVTAQSITGVVDYAILGHSERRNYFHESNEVIAKKMTHAKEHAIKTLLCVRDVQDMIDTQADIIAYEPVGAIGTGHNASVEDVLKIKKSLSVHVPFLYGGSVDQHNCAEYISSSEIDGLLVGTASLDPHHFFSIIASY